LAQLTAYRTQVEEKIKKELNNIFAKSGIICDGFLLSEVKDLGNLQNKSDDKIIFEESDKSQG